MTADALQALLDERDVRAVLHRYALAVDDRDWGRLEACFTADVDIAYENMPPFAGAADFVATVRPVLEQLASTQHLLGTCEVLVDGDAARARTYVQAMHVAGNGGQLVTGGCYHDELARTADGWRITRRRFTRQWFGGDRKAVLGARPAGS